MHGFELRVHGFEATGYLVSRVRVHSFSLPSGFAPVTLTDT